MDDLDSWAQKKAKEIRDRQKNEHVNREALIAEEKIKQASAPELWKQLRAALKTRYEKLLIALDDLNALVWIERGQDEITIKANNSSNFVSLTFQPEPMKVFVLLVGTADEFHVKLGQHGEPTWKSSSIGAVTSEYIANKIIDSISKVI